MDEVPIEIANEVWPFINLLPGLLTSFIIKLIILLCYELG